MAYKTPGVYIKEISTLPPTVSQVETAIPAFIGYTEKALDENGQAVTTFPYIVRIKSFKEYEERFGVGANIYVKSTDSNKPRFEITSGTPDILTLPITVDEPNKKYKMYYALQMFFANGGGPCYIASVGSYSDTIVYGSITVGLKSGLESIGKEDEPTIIVFPDAGGLSDTTYYTIFQDALSQCGNLGDRVTLVDLKPGTTLDTIESDFRTNIGNNNLKYGAAYYPSFQSIFTHFYDEEKLEITIDLGIATEETWILKVDEDGDEDKSVFHQKNQLYHQIKAELAKQCVKLAPSAAIAGIYAFVDSNRGVWKAPANVSVNGVKKLLVDIDDEDQKDLNAPNSGNGKSVNAIRNFTGKGTLVWGARTLDGNSGEWRYIPVRRFYNMAEESIKKASEAFVFESNDANTWVIVRAMIENFLFNQWRAGALAGPTPESAFYVRVGLGETMTAADVNAGVMNIEIGMAVVRPAEFIILKFSHKMQEA